MPAAKNQTVETDASVEGFIASVKDEAKRKDCLQLVALLRKHTKEQPKMWGPAIVGFGSHHYKYDSGREGDSPNVAFSPRASSIALYLSANFDQRAALLKKFGKHKAQKGCVHIRRLDDVDKDVLLEMVDNHIRHMKKLYPQK